MPDPRFESGSQFSELEIKEIEKIIGRDLPEDYRAFVKEYGGAFVGGFVDGHKDLPLLRFYDASHGGGIFNALNTYSDLKEDGALPFARCELGNIYAIDRNNAVHYINYYGGKTKSQKVAENFRDFISRIVATED